MKNLFIIFLFLPITCFATYWTNHDEGWHWYNDPSHETRKSHEEKQSHQTTGTTQIEALQKATKEQLSHALLDPSEQNVIRYITLQNTLVSKAARFSEMWQRVVWQHPELNYSVENPTSEVGRHAYYEKERLRRDANLSAISQRYGLFFYFSSSCTYCQKMAPTVKSFADYYGFDMIPITLDGQTLPEFPRALHDNGSMVSLKVEVVPALFLIDKKTKEIIPVGFGLMSIDELEKRTVVLISNQEAHHG